jgi:hypothetical protein
MRKRTIDQDLMRDPAGATPPEPDTRRADDPRGTGRAEEGLAECESLLRSVDEMEVPEPSAAMHHKFRALLEEAKAAQKAEARPALWTSSGLVPRLAVGLCLLVAGWFLGYQVTPRAERAQLDLLTGEIREMRKTLVLSNLVNPSAAERLRAVQSARNLTGADEAVFTALIQTMNADSNVSVRLEAVEALSRYASRPEVREALVQSIVRQESPLVQIALADVMLALNEKRAVEPLRMVIADPMVDYSVKSRLETTVRRLL